jgi:copper chaperone CopZ
MYSLSLKIEGRSCQAKVDEIKKNLKNNRTYHFFMGNESILFNQSKAVKYR